MRRKDDEISQRGPDPSEFEPELGVSNAEVPGSSTTSQSLHRNDGVPPPNEASNEEPRTSNGDDDKPGLNPSLTTEELPTDVRVKLRKLDKLESRYNGSSRKKFIQHDQADTL